MRQRAGGCVMKPYSGISSQESEVYALNACGDSVAVAPLPEVARDAVHQAGNIRMARIGPLICTGRALGHDGLVFMRPSHAWAPATPLRKWPHGAEPLDEFWRFASSWIKLHRHNRPYFPHILYELEFRYNHRHGGLFDPLMDILLGSGPPPAPAKTLLPANDIC